jgi:hypothetical protein
MSAICLPVNAASGPNIWAITWLRGAAAIIV